MSIGNWYRVGTVAVTNGSVNVVGTGTYWSSQCNPGDRFTVDGENWYEVNSITDDTHLALLSVGGSGAFAGTTGSNLAYAIDRNFTNNLNADIAAKVASLVAEYQANSNGPLSGLFGDGAVATPGIAFLNEASTGLYRPGTGIAALAVQGAEFLRAVGTASGVPGLLGLGTTAPAQALDIAVAYNALFGARIKNSSAGTAARAALQATNGAQVLNLGVNGANFAADGVLGAARGFVEGPNGVDFASGVTTGNAFSWGVGTSYTSKMVMDYLGDVSIGGSPVTVAGYTTLALNNATTGGILDLQANGVDVGRLTGSAAAVDLSAIGASVPVTITTNGAVRVKVDPSGNVLVGQPGTFGGNPGFVVNRTSGFSGAILQSSGSYGASFGVDITSGTTIAGSPAGSTVIRSGGPLLFSTSGTGAEFARLDTSGRLGLGVIPSAWGSAYSGIVQLGSSGAIAAQSNVMAMGSNWYYNSSGTDAYINTGVTTRYIQNSGAHYFQYAASGSAGTTISFNTALEIDSNGNLSVNAVAGNGYHVIAKNVNNDAGVRVLATGTVSSVGGTYTNSSIVSYAVSGTGANSANCALVVQKDFNTSRSVNAAGTLNASGADYAEYRQLVASLYGQVAKGALLGYDANGLMTNVFANVVGRVLPKSTAPSYVGNDTWGTTPNIVATYNVVDPGNAPAQVVEPTAPTVIANPGADASEDQAAAYAAYQAAAVAYAADLATYNTYVVAEAAYQANLAAFNAALETERVKWDRIALCGVVPVNISGLGTADIGKYLVPCAASDGTITATAVAKADLTLMQYIDSFGSIEAIGTDGRPLVNVKNG